MSKVNWHVANCTVTESAYDDPILELELTGYCDHKYLRSITDRNAWFAEIEKKLNADDRYDIHIDPYAFQKQMYKYLEVQDYIRKDTEMTKQIVNSVFGAKRLDIKKWTKDYQWQPDEEVDCLYPKLLLSISSSLFDKIKKDKKRNPVEEAYRLLIRDGKNVDLDEVIGYLGEALSD